MLKTLLAASLLLLPSLAFAGEAPKNFTEQALAPTVLLDMGCSGTVVFSKVDKEDEAVTLILTAKHCVDDLTSNQSVDVIIPTYQNNLVVSKVSYTAKVQSQDYASDLAVLRLVDKETIFPNIVKLAPSDVELFTGEPVTHVGYPLTGTISHTEGRFGSLTDSENDRGLLYQTSAPVYFGSSGGPLFHLRDNGDYEQIGVTCCGYVQDTSFINYWTPITAIQDFVERVMKDFEINEDQDRGPDVTPATN